MQTIEFETTIDADGNVPVPERYRMLYGHQARLVVLSADVSGHTTKAIDPMQYSNTLDWPVDGTEFRGDTGSDFEQLLDATKNCWHEEDGLAYQQRIRDEWQDDGENES